jgi:hypothetical protein
MGRQDEATVDFHNFVNEPKNRIHEEAKSTLNAGNACYHSAESCFPVYYPQIQRIKYTELQFCMGMKYGLSH